MNRCLAVVVVVIAACSSPSGSSENEIQFHGEQVVLPGFELDTGLQPAASPVQLQLVFSAGGAITADAKATAGGPDDAPTVAAVAGTGVFTVDAHVRLAAMLHVAITGLPSYDGPIPGIENIDIAFGGQAVFDPFLIGGTAHVDAPLPETELPPIPLPGGIPGNLTITIAAGSVLTSDLSGLCAGVDAGTVQFLAQTVTSGTLLLDPKIVITTPLGDQEFPIPRVTVPLPSTTVPMDLGTHDIIGGGEAPTGASLATAGSCDGVIDDPTACPDPTPDYVSAWHPPLGPESGACSKDQIAEFIATCVGMDATQAACDEFRTANAMCTACLITPLTAPSHGALVTTSIGTELNVGGCIALLDPGLEACGRAFQDLRACEESSCAACADDATMSGCIAGADTAECATYTGDVESCWIPVGESEASYCIAAVPPDEAVGFYSLLFCGPVL